MTTKKSIVAGICWFAFVCMCMPVSNLRATCSPCLQQERDKKEGTKLVVSAEDELAYVHEIEADIKRRLGEPMKKVELDLIMEGPAFSGTAPSRVRWDGDSSRLWFHWKRWDEEEAGTYEYMPVSGDLRKLTREQADFVPSHDAVWNYERSLALWTVRSSILIYNTASKSTRALLKGVNDARPITFSSDGRTAVISYKNNLFALPINSVDDVPMLRQLTDIREGQPPRKGPINDHQRWLREQQIALFEVIRRAEEQRKEQQEQSEKDRIKPLYLAGWRVAELSPDPTLDWVAVQQLKPSGQTKIANVPNYVTVSGFTEDIKTRTKVGNPLAESRIGILDVDTGEVVWADFGLGDRKITVGGATWSPDGSKALVQVFAQDNKDRWFAVLTPKHSNSKSKDLKVKGGRASSNQKQEKAVVSGFEIEVVIVTSDHDDAWINWGVARGYGWLPGGDAIYFVSERHGSMHIYTVSAEGGEPTALTSGDFVVLGPELTHDRSAFVFGASIPSPFEVQAYRLPISGGEPEALTEGLGRMDITLSPDNQWIAGIGSKGNEPWELYVKQVGDTGVGTKVTDSPSPAFKSYAWIEPEIVHFPAQDGTQVPARLYKPTVPHADRPAVIFSHGGGYMHNVHNWWSRYYSREYTFHHLLMERGYTVLDIDYRGSAGYGRDWRTAIYRHMGGKDLSDHVDGARYLVTEFDVGQNRIGIYGGSYGGFITLMAMFTAPDSFAAGASLRPVTDWASYNHPYTSNILNTPVEDPEAHIKSSPIYFAENLKGALLICHGLIDLNVHAQDTIRLAQRLIELRKENWEVMLYPVEYHVFREASSWYDEYRRILKLFEENLKD